MITPVPTRLNYATEVLLGEDGFFSLFQVEDDRPPLITDPISCAVAWVENLIFFLHNDRCDNAPVVSVRAEGENTVMLLVK